MKTKLALMTGLLFVFLFFVGVIFEQRLNIPPFPEELTTLIVAKTNSLKEVNQSEKTQILNHILGSEGLQNENIFFLRNSLGFFGSSIESVRYLNLIFLLLALFFMLLTLKGFGQEKVILIATVIIIFCSPLFFNLWIVHPKISLTIFLLNFWIYLKFLPEISNRASILALLINFLIYFSSFQGFFVGIVLTLLTIKSQIETRKFRLLLVTLFVFMTILLSAFRSVPFKKTFSSLPIINHSTLSYVTEEITARIGKEDGLTEKVAFPLWFRRIGYNKIFFIYKNVSIDLVNFFDPETWFFQEVHPLQQKSEVIFFWPEIILFVLGLITLVKSKNKEFQQLIILLFLMSLIFFLTSVNESPSIKYSLVLFCFSIIIAYGLLFRFKIVSVLLILLSLWGLTIGYYDLAKRPLFWFDNRPYVYSEGLQSLKKVVNLPFKPNNVVITTLVGNPKLYYLYYFSLSPSLFQSTTNTIIHNNIGYTFNSFDLKAHKPVNNTLYLGFLGEYVGSNPKNDFSFEQELIKIKNLGFEINKTWTTNDTIAYKYGNYFILVYYP